MGAVIAILITLGFGGLIILLGGWVTARNIKDAVEGMVNVTMLKKSGVRIDELYPVDGDTVGVKKRDGTTGSYQLGEGVTFDMLWPPGGWWPPKFMRATVRSMVIAEGNAEPYRPWATEPLITDEQLNRAKTQGALHALIGKAEAQFGGKLATKLGLSPWVVYTGLIVISILALVGLIMGYMAWSGTEKVVSGFGL